MSTKDQQMQHFLKLIREDSTVRHITLTPGEVKVYKSSYSIHIVFHFVRTPLSK